MSPAREGNVLLGALLDRLGAAQAQALLSQLDQWLASTSQPNTKRFDRDQIHAVEGPYDRRRQNGTGFQTRQSTSASPTPKDTSS
jgi:hypothetical protein